MTRPEYSMPADMFYGDTEAVKYTHNTRVMDTQCQLAERCLEILAIPPGKKCIILDIGCGSGLSGSVISEHGHDWIGLDISPAMLKIAKENEVEGDLFLCDIGQGFNFRPGTIDYAISVSAIQWLCVAEKSIYNPEKRLEQFFKCLYNCLVMGARVCLQFYPDNATQISMITNAALKVGFSGGVLVDYPHSTKAKKFYLFLQSGYTQESIKAVMDNIKMNGVNEGEDDEEHAEYIKKKKNKKKKDKIAYRSRQWIKKKKDRQKQKGKDVRPDSKFTGRKRKQKGI